MPERRILLVEDDRDLAPILEHVLLSEGYTVDVARNMAQAQAHLDQQLYTLVIADLRLPDGDGLEIADHAAETGLKTAIISGYVHQLAPEIADRHEVWRNRCARRS